MSPEGRVREAKDVGGFDNVDPGLVLVHRVQDGLQDNVGDDID